MILQRTEKYEI